MIRFLALACALWVTAGCSAGTASAGPFRLRDAGPAIARAQPAAGEPRTVGVEGVEREFTV